MITLKVERDKKSTYVQTTVLKDSKGKVKAIFNSMLRQPRKNQKTIVINCSTYNLDWSAVQ